MVNYVAFAESIAPYFAEFLGTFFVAFALGCAAVSGDVIWTPTCIAFTTMCAMYAVGSVPGGSGGHLSPALTISFGLAGKLKSWREGVLFCMAQLAAAFLAAGLSVGLLSTPVPVRPQPGFGWIDAMIMETTYTAMMSFVALNTMASTRNNPKKDKNQFSGIAVGFVYIAGGTASLGVSGCHFNPALTLAFGVISNSSISSEVSWRGLYLLYQGICIVIASALFFLVRPEELQALIGEGKDVLRPVKWLMSCFSFLFSCCRMAPTARRETSDSDLLPLEEAKAPASARFTAELVGSYLIVFTFMVTLVNKDMGQHWIGPSHVASVPVNASGTQSASLLYTNGYHGGIHGWLHLQPTQAPQAPVHHNHVSAAGWSTGAAMMSLAYSLGGVSGAHFNPAVTMAVVCSGRGHCGFIEGFNEITMQAGGAVLAACVFQMMTPNTLRLDYSRLYLTPRFGWDWMAVAICESFFTLAVAFVVMSMTTVKCPRYLKATSTRSFQFALAMGMCYASGTLALDGISGGPLNPAVCLGMAAVDWARTAYHFDVGRVRDLLVYIIFECLGGVLAAVAFAIMHPCEYKKDPLLAQARN